MFVVAPDNPNGFLDFVMPADVIQNWDVTQQVQADTLTRCPYCGSLHQASQIEQCPLKPRLE
jgi:hypothetical protein